jgi:hypothetical protein
VDSRRRLCAAYSFGLAKTPPEPGKPCFQGRKLIATTLDSCIRASSIDHREHCIDFTKARAPDKTCSREIRADVDCDKGFCALGSYFRTTRPTMSSKSTNRTRQPRTALKERTLTERLWPRFLLLHVNKTCDSVRCYDHVVFEPVLLKLCRRMHMISVASL